MSKTPLKRGARRGLLRREGRRGDGLPGVAEAEGGAETALAEAGLASAALARAALARAALASSFEVKEAAGADKLMQIQRFFA